MPNGGMGRPIPLCYGLDMVCVCPPKGSCTRRLVSSGQMLRDDGAVKDEAEWKAIRPWRTPSLEEINEVCFLESKLL